MKEFEGIVIFLEGDLDFLEPWLYRSKFFKHKIECSTVNLEGYDGCRVKIKGYYQKKKNLVTVAAIEEI